MQSYDRAYSKLAEVKGKMLEPIKFKELLRNDQIYDAVPIQTLIRIQHAMTGRRGRLRHE